MHNTPKRWVLGVLYYLLIYPQKDTGFKKWFNLDLNKKRQDLFALARKKTIFIPT